MSATGWLYLIIGIGWVFSLVVQGWLRNTYRRWSQVRNSLNMPGADVARHLLDKNNMREFRVTMQRGSLTDHYDPRSKTVSLSERIFLEPSVASAAVAAHETGHALQDKTNYSVMRLRHKMLPIAQIGAQYGPWAAIVGWFMGSDTLIQIGFILFAAALLFQILSLPIEFDASRRARRQMADMGLDSESDRVGAHKVLRAAAMTYVANAATAMGQIVFVLVFAGRGLFKKFFEPPAPSPPPP
ncbi:MAG: zinc metallopeptidase [Pirellulaceae bacterium]